jgi:hypothetical protein
MTHEPADQATPGVEPPERFPGGVDSVADEDKYGDIPDQPLTRDLATGDNPAISDQVSDALAEPESSQDEPASDGASEPEKETQA